MSIFQKFNIYFYNNFHNGDVFYSKEFVRDIKNKIGSDHYYIHLNDFSILKDFDIKQIRDITPDKTLSVSKKYDKLYINTWIGQQSSKYLKYNCSLKSNYLLYSDIYKTLELEIEPISFYIPSVDFTKIININNYFYNKKSVLICNNDVHSGQSVNFDFDPIIDKISDIFKDVEFIITNNTKIIKPNVINASHIIGLNYNNLLEISYLSTKTDTIIGRASGPYCFTHIRDNMNNPNKTFIAFSNDENEGKWVSETESQAKQYWSNNYNIEYITNYIQEIIKNKYTNG